MASRHPKSVSPLGNGCLVCFLVPRWRLERRHVCYDITSSPRLFQRFPFPMPYLREFKLTNMFCWVLDLRYVGLDSSASPPVQRRVTSSRAMLCLRVGAQDMVRFVSRLDLS